MLEMRPSVSPCCISMSIAGSTSSNRRIWYGISLTARQIWRRLFARDLDTRTPDHAPFVLGEEDIPLAAIQQPHRTRSVLLRHERIR